MAGDWIPVEEATPRKPEVMRIVALVSRSRHEVVGLLIEFWIWISQNSADGTIDVPLAALPHLIGADDAFWQAVASVGWVKEKGGRLHIPNSEHWLTHGAKARLSNTRRQQNRRADVTPQARQMRDKQRDKSATTEQKRTEESNTPLSPPKGGRKENKSPSRRKPRGETPEERTARLTARLMSYSKGTNDERIPVAPDPPGDQRKLPDDVRSNDPGADPGMAAGNGRHPPQV